MAEQQTGQQSGAERLPLNLPWYGRALTDSTLPLDVRRVARTLAAWAARRGYRLDRPWPAPTLPQLARALGVDGDRCHRALEQLAAEGWLARTPGPVARGRQRYLYRLAIPPDGAARPADPTDSPTLAGPPTDPP